jgi:hypothetical protein
MRIALRALWITFAGVFLVAGAFAQSMERRETARAALEKVRKEAARWHADAKLISVVGKVDAKGFSNNNGPGGMVEYPDGWNYTFSSPSAREFLYIRLDFRGLGTSEMQAAPGHEQGEPLPPDFLDSDQAMAVARKNGFSAKSADYHYPFHMQLGTPLDTSVKEPFCWQVTDDEGTSFFVSAKSGKLLAKVPVDR